MAEGRHGSCRKTYAKEAAKLGKATKGPEALKKIDLLKGKGEEGKALFCARRRVRQEEEKRTLKLHPRSQGSFPTKREKKTGASDLPGERRKGCVHCIGKL